MPRALFLYDLGSPYAYLAAERLDAVFREGPEWLPVLAGGIFKALGRTPWPETPARPARMREVEERARARGLPPLRWPDPWPNDWLAAMRAAVFADERGRGKSYAFAAFRAEFVEGRSLADPETIALAAGRAGLDPEATLAATADPAIKAWLRENTDRALALGATGVPTIVVGRELFWGDDRLEEAAARAGDAAAVTSPVVSERGARRARAR